MKKRMIAIVLAIACVFGQPMFIASGTAAAASKKQILVPVDVSAAEITSSKFDIGDVMNCFDNNVESIMRSKAVNPCFVQIEFLKKVSVSMARVFLGQPGFTGDKNNWYLDAANSDADLNNKTGSYIQVVKTRKDVMGTWDEAVFSAVERKIWRFTIKRTVGDAYVHVRELALYTTAEELPAPKIESVKGYQTTATLAWTKSGNKDIAGYAIFRKEANGKYPSEPTWTTVPDARSNTVKFNDFNLKPDTTYVYTIATYNKSGAINSRFSKEISVTMMPAGAALGRAANLRVLVAMYTKDMTKQEQNRLINSVLKGMEFFYRNSLGRLNLEPTFIFLDGTYQVVNNDHMLQFERDLRARGVKDNQFDGFFLMAKENLPGFLGGYVILGNTFGGLGYAPTPAREYMDEFNRGELYGMQVWIFVHEFGHALDGLSDQYSEMLFNHPPWAYPLPKGYTSFNWGEGFASMAPILRLYNGYTKYKAPHNGYIEYFDSDKDGLADSDMRLPVDENRFGSNPSSRDADNDGLSDLQEYCAGIYTGSDPYTRDTDGDGIPDGKDATPLCDFCPSIKRFTTPPQFNGNITGDWTKLAGKPTYQTDKSLKAAFYAGWDDNYLYMAVESNKKIKLWLSVDGSGQNGRFETDGVFAGYTNWNTNKHSPTSYGDCYSSEACLYIDPNKNTVQKRTLINMAKGEWSGDPKPVDSSQVFYSKNGNKHTMMIKIPKALGPGIGFSYWKPGTPTIDGLRLSAGRILGFQLTYARAETASWDEFSGTFSSMNEMGAFYTSVLSG